MFGHLNINSIKNKLELLVEQVKGNLDVLMEPKLMIVFLLVSSGQMVFVHFTYLVETQMMEAFFCMLERI